MVVLRWERGWEMKIAEMEKRIEKVVGVGVGLKKLKHNIHPGVKKKGTYLRNWQNPDSLYQGS